MTNTDGETPHLVITGGSAGIGLATARRFAEAGWHVVNLSRGPTPLAGAVQIFADFTDPDWTDAAGPALRAALPAQGRICLIHNAGSKHAGPVTALDGPSLRQCLEVNAVAPALLNLLVLPHMAAGSAILYVGSTLSHRATRDMAAYTMSKHALAGLMRSTAQDLAGRSIHTACICPGFTETDMLRAYGADALRHLSGLVTQRRLIDPDEIASTLLFAAHSPVINGSMLMADLCFNEP